ncbi:MAG: 3-hydroxyacyl-CoA dehydrogenase [Pseudomonadota bacterium]
MKIAVIGAGVMGRGIAQLFLVSGHSVTLCDASSSQLDSAVEEIKQRIGRLIDKGRLSGDIGTFLKHLHTVENMEGLDDSELVIEAIVEDRQSKIDVLKKIESRVNDGCIVASNTSSLSISDLASCCAVPGRIAGLHFFNPVPLMKLVEVVAGERTDIKIINRLTELVAQTGHRAVCVTDTPGFLVNHLGRAFSTEGLKMLQERIAAVETLDAIARDAGGFRMGPFELLDLTGLDVSVPVMEQIHAQYYQDPRLRPSEIGRRRLHAGRLGRKTVQGFYNYAETEQSQPTAVTDESAKPIDAVSVCAFGDAKDRLEDFLDRINVTVLDGAELVLVAPLGTDVSTESSRYSLDASAVVGIDTVFGLDTHVTVALNPRTDSGLAERLCVTIRQSGIEASIVRDSAGLVLQRVVAMIVNLAAEIAQQGIARPDDIDAAIVAALGYPKGPLEWGDHLGAKTVWQILMNLQQTTGDDRYRPSPWLRQRALTGASLLHE